MVIGVYGILWYGIVSSSIIVILVQDLMQWVWNQAAYSMKRAYPTEFFKDKSNRGILE